MSYEKHTIFESKLTGQVFEVEYEFIYNNVEHTADLYSWKALDISSKEEVQIVDKQLSEEIENFCQSLVDKEDVNSLEDDYNESRVDYYYDMIRDELHYD